MCLNKIATNGLGLGDGRAFEKLSAVTEAD